MWESVEHCSGDGGIAEDWGSLIGQGTPLSLCGNVIGLLPHILAVVAPSRRAHIR